MYMLPTPIKYYEIKERNEKTHTDATKKKIVDLKINRPIIFSLAINRIWNKLTLSHSFLFKSLQLFILYYYYNYKIQRMS